LIMKETSVTLISPHTDRTELVSMMRGIYHQKEKVDESSLLAAGMLDQATLIERTFSKSRKIIYNINNQLDKVRLNIDFYYYSSSVLVDCKILRSLIPT